MKTIPRYHYSFSLSKHRAKCYIERIYAKDSDPSHRYRIHHNLFYKYRRYIVNSTKLKKHKISKNNLDRVILPFVLNRTTDETICNRLDLMYRDSGLHTNMQKFIYRYKKWGACCD
jgi:hypothetical protein